MNHRLAVLTSLAIAIALFAAVATAQDDENGCTQDHPCDWVFDIDENGFIGDPSENMMFAEGDWYVVRIFNFDLLEDHTVTLQGYAPWHVPSLDEYISEPFRLAPAGTLNLTDSPSGDSIMIHVAVVDPILEEEEPTRRIPGPGALAVGLVLLGGAAVRRSG